MTDSEGTERTSRFRMPGGVGLLLLAMVGVSAGCAYARVEPGFGDGHGGLPSNARILVLTPRDAAYGRHVYRGSGVTLARRTLAIVRKRYPLAQPSNVSESVALEDGPSAGIDYIVSPEILHWEDRATPWSGFRDKVRVEVRILETRAPRVVSSMVFESRNNSITLIDGRPEDLLDRDYERAVLSLF